MGEDDALGRRRHPVQQLNPPTAGGSERTVQIGNALEDDAGGSSHRTKLLECDAWVAGHLSELRQAIAVGLCDVLSRDSATWLSKCRLTSRVIEVDSVSVRLSLADPRN
jgi:hypothetical protein